MSENKEKSGSPLIIFLLVMVVLCCFICVLCFGSFAVLGSIDASSLEGLESSNAEQRTEVVAGDSSSGNTFLSIPITGIILGDPELDQDLAGGGLFGIGNVTYGYNIKTQLENASQDDSIKGVILEINSGGGTINGSKAIVEGIEYYREQTGNPVIASVVGFGASGAYWVAAAADEVYADFGSSVGSIGVIYGPFKYYDEVIAEGGLLQGEVLTQNGIETKYFTAGEGKDFGNPYRRLTQKEARVIQQSIDNEYNKFVQEIAKFRSIEESTIREEIGALLYGVDQAKSFGLIDEVVQKDETYSILAEEAEVSDYKIIRRYPELGFWDALLMGAFSQLSGPEAQREEQSMQNHFQSCSLCNQPLYFHGSY